MKYSEKEITDKGSLYFISTKMGLIHYGNSDVLVVVKNTFL